MSYEAINFEEKLAKFSDHFKPKIIAQMNNYHFKVVKFQGEFVWHKHEDTDEVFMDLDGEIVIQLRDRRVEINNWENIYVPKGKEHKPTAERECKIILVEPAGTVNTGDSGGNLTAEDDVWI